MRLSTGQTLALIYGRWAHSVMTKTNITWPHTCDIRSDYFLTHVALPISSLLKGKVFDDAHCWESVSNDASTIFT